ncbi:IS630 family transposase [Streptomyces sp. NPDC059168]|uniref:IS630 family transposase n=1 Tax=Streptomyces sp. NPDC059168 TaxID=3346753 RepID=UPI00368FF5A0
MNRPGPKNPPLSVTDAQRAVLEGWLRRGTTAQALAQRSQMVLECAEGHSIMEVSRRLRIAPDTVRTWRRRFIERGLDDLCDDPRPGVPRKITDADVERVIVKTLEETPKNATHWSTRSMAVATGMSQSTISRIWRAFALAPHRSQTFKLSTDPLFIDKVRDVVGLYLDPPEKALVLCVDERSQIQALDRSQPVLPMVPEVPERRSHDYVRAGTTTLFTARGCGGAFAGCPSRESCARSHVTAGTELELVMSGSSRADVASDGGPDPLHRVSECVPDGGQFLVAEPGAGGFQMTISNRAKPQGQSYSSASSEVAAPQQGTTTARVAKPSSQRASIRSAHHSVSIDAPHWKQPIFCRFGPQSTTVSASCQVTSISTSTPSGSRRTQKERRHIRQSCAGRRERSQVPEW